jgi:hypothetical protein
MSNLVSELYERTSSIITSNKGFVEWAEMMGDDIMTTAMVDRLVHHVRILSMGGDSYRVQHSQTRSNEEELEPAAGGGCTAARRTVTTRGREGLSIHKPAIGMGGEGTQKCSAVFSDTYLFQCPLRGGRQISRL